jgi:hypothetical protein
MEIKRAIKKIVALGIGTTMMGATLLGAMAADLSDFAADGSPFIKDGAFDGIIVVGDSAAAQDVIGSVDIATSLQYASTTQTQVNVGSSTQINVVGDAKKIAESSNVLEIGENLNTVKSGITGTDLNALAGGDITNSQGTYSYSQDIVLPTGLNVTFTLDPDDTTDTPQMYLKLDSAKDPNVYVYKTAFSPALKSRHSTAASDDLRDIEDKKITLLGKQYTIIDTDHSAQNNTVLKLMGGSTQDTIQEYETKTYTVNGVDYEVECLIVDDNAQTTKLKIKGEITDELGDGETYKLSDGTEVGIKNVLANEGTETGGGDLVEFYLGASKVELTDTDTANHNWGGTLKVGGETIDNVKLDIKTGSDAGIANDAIMTISSIEVNYSASQDLYVPVDGKLSEAADAAEGETGNFFLNGFDIEFRGLEVGVTEEISLKPQGDNNYKLGFTNKNGVTYNEPVLAYDATNNIYFFGKYSGSTARNLIINETEAIADEETFTVNKNKYSHLLQFKDVQAADNIAKIKDLGSSDTLEISYDATGLGYINLDGNRFEIRVDETNKRMWADFDGDGWVNSTIIAANQSNPTGGRLYTQYGALIQLAMNATSPGAENTINITSELLEDKATADTVAVALVRTSTNKLDIASSADTSIVSNGAAQATSQVGSTNVYQAWTRYGIFYELDKQSSTTEDQDQVTIQYPDEQVSAAVFVSAGVTSANTVEGASGTITTTTITPIEVGAAKLASEVSDITAVNAIVVGGPCANAAAATLMGNPANCAAGFTEGKAMIKLIENGDNVAMLVAGATAMDTRRASRVVANAGDYADQLAGMEVEVSGTSLTEITVGVPTVVAAPSEGEAEAEAEAEAEGEGDME